MGYIRHHTIVVTSWSEPFIEEAHRTATDIFPWVSAISPTAMNGFRSFFVPPDGSKEGWEASNQGDERRQRFFAWLDDQRYEDDSTSLQWVCVEIQYGDDERQTKATVNPCAKVIRDSDDPWRATHRRQG